MVTKITTSAQIENLKAGDTISKYPTQGPPEATFNESLTTKIENFDVRSINPNSKIVELVMTRDFRMLFALPGDISRLFIHSDKLKTESLWWITNAS